MNILALDTAFNVFSVALATETDNFYMEIETKGYKGTPRHSELLMECIDKLFNIAMFTSNELDLVACMKGPGSFTGLRIGFSTAKGLTTALGIPLVSIPTLDCIAFPLSMWPGIIIPLIDAKKGCFFSAIYRENKRLTDYFDISPENLALQIEKYLLHIEESILLTGPGAELFFSLLPAKLSNKKLSISVESKRGRAWELLEIVKSTRIEDRTNNNSSPLYIRKSDAELSRN